MGSASKNSTETEVKIPLVDRAAIAERLQNAGFRISIAREWESNDLYDTDDQSLRGRQMLLRLRQSGHQSLMTWKGPGRAGRHKSRPELETTIGSVEIVGRVFEQLGYTRKFRYEKYRTEFINHARQGVITIDQTPIGDFLEIEGPGDWIDATAQKLGFSQSDYVLESYGQLYLNYCAHHGVEPADMVFASH